MPKVNVTLELSENTIIMLDALKKEYGVSRRSRVLEMLVEELVNPVASEA